MRPFADPINGDGIRVVAPTGIPEGGCAPQQGFTSPEVTGRPGIPLPL